jgi:cell division protein FtsZ
MAMPLRSDTRNFRASIRDIGVGSRRSNAVNRMDTRAEMMGVEFIACNTDAQALLQSDAPHKIRIGDKITGASGRRRLADRARAAEEDREKIAQALADSDMVFITAGLGGGTGSAAPRRRAARQGAGRADDRRRHQAVQLRGRKRKLVAEKAAEELKAQVDTLITIPTTGSRTSSRRTPRSSTRSASSTTSSARASRDQRHHHDARTHQPRLRRRPAIMKDAGSALMGIGRATGENRAVEAARQAIASPLLEVEHRRRPGDPVQHHRLVEPEPVEVTEAAEEIRAAADPEANIIFGTSFNERLGEEVMITVIATGFDGSASATVSPARVRQAGPAIEARSGAARARLPRGAAAPARGVGRRR